MSYEPPVSHIDEWVAFHLPRAVAWAEADIFSTKMQRAANLMATIRRGRCPLGHELGQGSWDGCGYCRSAVEHAEMFTPPDPTTRKEMP